MNKFFFLFLFAANLSFIYSQYKINNLEQSNSNINFDIILPQIDYTTEKGASGTSIVKFAGYINESEPGKPALPYTLIYVALPSVSKVKVESSIVSSQKINGYPQLNPEVTQINDSTITYKKIYKIVVSTPNPSANIIEVADYIWIRDYYCAVLRINQYIDNTNGTIEQLDKIHVSVKVNTLGNYFKIASDKKDLYEPVISKMIINYSPSLRMEKSRFTNTYDSLTDWIDYSKTYVKLGVSADNVYRITPEDLSLYSIDYASIDPATFKIFLKGKEIPILVHYNDKTISSSWDYVEFFGLKNKGGDYKKVNNKNEPYNEYRNRYSDTTVYWLTWSGPPGLRIDTLLNYNGTIKDTVSTYTESAHYEQDQWLDYSEQDIVRRQLPEWIGNETWVWGQQGVGTAVKGFSATDIVPNKTAEAFYKVQDYASDILNNAHQIGLTINDDKTVLGLESFNKYEQKVIHGTFPSDLLTNGPNKLFTISYQTSASLNAIAVDWYEIDYPRYIKAIDDSLEFQVNDTLSDQPVVVKVTNLTESDYALYKISNGLKKISNYKLVNGTLTFADSVTPGSKYFLIKSANYSKPKIFYKKKFNDISADSIQADYILITHPQFMNAAKDYTAFINENYNVTTKLINVFDIYDEFNYGFFAPEPIKYFLQFAFDKWKSPKPSYVFLVGDANYDYRNNKVKYFGTPLIPNYVPSYGVSVSDNWYAVWDSTGPQIPQMYMGRLPVNSADEFEDYLQRHKSYVSMPFDDWNKRYLFISGGDANNPSELLLLKDANKKVINEVVNPKPISGIWTHFYKTLNPSTNLGPYTNEQIRNKLDSGSVIISYLGHSGTQIWDNGINNPQQIANARGKFSLVTDYGCSTGKFAEPDIKSFSELFTVGPDANAIGFIANTSLGFQSTSVVFPEIFYRNLLTKENPSLGQAHVMSKMEMIQTYGSSEVYTLFSLCNTLFADPIIKLKIPTKPNLHVENNNIKLDNYTVDSITDSVKLICRYFNLGLADSSLFNISISVSLNNEKINEFNVEKIIPGKEDSIEVYIHTKNKVGNYKIIFTLDPDNMVDEIYKTDNSADIEFNVVSNEIRSLYVDNINNESTSSIIVLNPTNSSNADSMRYQLAANPNFDSPKNNVIPLGEFYSTIELNNLLPNVRYWLRTKLENQTAEYSQPVSFFYNPEAKNAFTFQDSLGFSGGSMQNLQLVNNELGIAPVSKKLEVVSAGFYEGNYATITVNGEEYLSLGHLDGPHVVVFDSLLNFKYEKTFDYWSNTNAFENNLLSFLDTVSTNEIIAFANSGGGGSGLTTKIREAIANFGSAYIDSIQFRYSWAMIGRKGAAPGSVPESWSKPFEGAVQIDSVFTFQNDSGEFITPVLGPVKKWNDLTFNIQSSDNSQIRVYPITISNNGVADTLAVLSFINGKADLSFLNEYSKLQFAVHLTKRDLQLSPVFRSMTIGYERLPELGTNYQTINVSSDSLKQGETENLSFYVYNVGESTADSFKVKVEQVAPDNSREQIFEQFVDSLGSEKRKEFELSFNTTTVTGKRSFHISIDPENKVNELYKYNNIYSVPFYVKPNDAPASLKLTIDGSDIFDGDYISPNPLIRIELNDQSIIPISDTNAVQIYLNGNRVALNNNFVDYSFSVDNPKFVINYQPRLDDGDYILKVLGKNATGDLIDSTGIVKRFSINNKSRLLEVYNYPNPIKDDTYFTFKLTQIPDELKVKIFTIAGRLVKEINLNSSELNYDFNRVYWNGRDEDGNLLANGVYLYKVIMRKGSQTIDAVQKLAIVR